MVAVKRYHETLTLSVGLRVGLSVDLSVLGLSQPLHTVFNLWDIAKIFP